MCLHVCVLYFCVHTLHTYSVCVCVCMHCADWASVLAIRKTTSGKVHINHVLQLKERNGAEMGGRKNNERLCLRYSKLLHYTVCDDMMLEAFMNKQGHDNRPKSSA